MSAIAKVYNTVKATFTGNQSLPSKAEKTAAQTKAAAKGLFAQATSVRDYGTCSTKTVTNFSENF